MYLNEREINILRGKGLVGHLTQKETLSLFNHIDCLEMLLDEADQEDTFGTEGWRHNFA